MEITKVKEILQDLTKQGKLRNAEEIFPNVWQIPSHKEETYIEFIFGETFECTECEKEEKIEEDRMTASASNYIAISSIDPRIGIGDVVVILTIEDGVRKVLSMASPSWMIKIKWIEESVYE